MATLYRPLLPPQERHEAAASLLPVRLPELPGAFPRPALPASSRTLWQLPPCGLVLFHGAGEVTRLSHYFLPRLLQEGRRVLFLDGANCADPRLIARFARERGEDFHAFSRQIRIARAFTCFQLTEMVARVPQMLADFPAQVLMVTALPELYFDEDVRHSDARTAFRSALVRLRRWSGLDAAAPVRVPLAVAVFSAASTFHPPAARRSFMPEAFAAASEVWQFHLDEQQHLRLVWARSETGPAAAWPPEALPRRLRDSSAR